MSGDMTTEALSDGDSVTVKVTYAWVIGGFLQRVEFGAGSTVRPGEATQDAINRVNEVAVSNTFDLTDEITSIAAARKAASTTTAAQPGTGN